MILDKADAFTLGILIGFLFGILLGFALMTIINRGEKQEGGE